MEITESNKLIAEFMKEKFLSDEKGRKYYNHVNIEYPENFEFNTSWDWLMPVVEKIRTFCIDNYGDTDRMGDIFRGLHMVQIETAYKYVVKFINWHNEQTKTSK